MDSSITAGVVVNREVEMGSEGVLDLVFSVKRRWNRMKGSGWWWSGFQYYSKGSR